MPLPSRPNVPGFGTVLLTGVVVAKQVGLLPQNSPATWILPTVIPVEISALLRTKSSELVVALPLASRQIVSAANGMAELIDRYDAFCRFWIFPLGIE